MFLIRDGAGRVFNKVKNPAAVYDSASSVLLKIGEKEAMEDYFNHINVTYSNFGFNDIAEDVCIMDLPRDQEEIDKVFGICDYIGKLHRKKMN